jgi:large subunit ribosomal protein L28
MARVCSLTGKKRLSGNSVSHSQRKTRRVQHPNLITKRIFIPEENRTVKVKLSVSALRTINKKGLQQVLKDEGIQL